MTTILITALFILLSFDLIIGNYLFPSKEGIVKTKDRYYKVYKYNRIFFVPIRMWYAYYSPSNTTHVMDFTTYSDAAYFRIFEDAQDVLTSKRKGEKTISHEKYGIDYEVYSTKDKTTNQTNTLNELIKEATTDEEKRVLTSIAERLKS